MKEIYLDNAATTMVCNEAAQLSYKIMTEYYGNPSSTHKKGREAANLLKTARSQVCNALDCAENELFFTSCGSEGDNWAIINGAESRKRLGNHIISSSVEHDAVRKSMNELEKRGFEVTYLSPDKNGAISADSVISSLRDDTILVSLMMVNNETGAITDISAISKALKTSGSKAILHTDAVQGFMKVPFSAKKLGADLITISGHKIHAPKGVGALYVKSGTRILPYVLGGSQEHSMRAGTEALPQIAAFGVASEIAYKNLDHYIKFISNLRDIAIQQIASQLPDAVIIGGGSPHIISVSLPGWRSEVIMNYMESKGIYISRSSACKKGGRSHVLEAMNLDNTIIDGAIRVSLSRYSTESDVIEFCNALKSAHDTLIHS